MDVFCADYVLSVVAPATASKTERDYCITWGSVKPVASGDSIEYRLQMSETSLSVNLPTSEYKQVRG